MKNMNVHTVEKSIVLSNNVWQIKKVEENMQRRISVQFTELFWILVRKIWLFILIMAIFVVIGMLQTTTAVSENTAYSITGKILVSQQTGENVGELMDNASRIQPMYDSIEILTTGIFLQRTCDDLPFEMTVSELKNNLKVEQVSPTRIVSIEVSGESAEKVQTI